MTARTACAMGLSWIVCAFACAQGYENKSQATDPVELLRTYLQIDTTNPPGNELQAAKFFADIFEREGIPYEIIETAPGRANIYARLNGGEEPGLLLSHHTDVVPADAEQWDHPPFAAEVHNGYVYGRGALDNKCAGIFHLLAFLELHRAQKPLRRDVVFLAVADEEAGGEFGMGWLAEHRPDVFEGVGLAFNEGGGGIVLEDGRIMFEVEVAHKGAVWVRLTAHGEPGHGSSPRAESAVTRLLDALQRIRERPIHYRLTPHVRDYFQKMTPHIEDEWHAAFADIDSAIDDPAFRERLLDAKRWYHALLYDTVSITMLEGSDKVNVIPATASAELDCRILPDTTPEEFVAELTTIIGDPKVDVEVTRIAMPSSSTADSELFDAFDAVRKKWYPDSSIVPMAMTGFTDSRFLRNMGIVCYGVDPAVLPESEFDGVHGHNERISIENIENATRFNMEVVHKLVY